MVMLLICLLAVQMSANAAVHQKKKTTIETIAKAPEASQPVLLETIHNGHYIRLTDNSLWEINPNDVLITQSWITPVPIIASKTDDPDYPFKLTNSLTGSSVRAKRVENIPLPAAPDVKKK